MTNEKKVAIVGCGFVGSSSAFALMQSGLFSEMVLIDVDKNRAEGEALDIAHGMAFAEPMKIYAGDYSDVSDAAMVVVTAGAAQKPGETRLDLVNKNVKIFKSIIPEIKKSGFDGILLIVSNPVDVLTYAAIIRAVWGYSDYGSVKKLQVNMKNIRKKMGVTPGEKRYIINELGVGYRMLAEDEA